MANITLKTRRDGTDYYKIKVRTSKDGKIEEYSTHFDVPIGKSGRTIKSELTAFVADFEAKCKSGQFENRQQRKDRQAREAKEAAEKERLERMRLALEEAKNITVKDFAEKNYMPAKLAGLIGKRAVSENTRCYYQNALDKHIVPAIGSMIIGNVTKTKLEELLLEKHNEGISSSLITSIYITICQLFDYAVDRGLITVSPAYGLKKPQKNKAGKKKENTVSAYSIEDIQHIIQCLENEPLKWRAYITLLIDSGMRRAEACGLKWKNVDFKNGTVKIDTNLLYTSKAGIYEDTPKTETSCRTIDVDPIVLDLFKKLRIEQAENIISPYVFCQADGSAMNPQSPTRYFARFGKKYGIDNFHPHGLRHSFASIAITNGADAASVSEKLGHANKGITMKMYVHSNPKSIKDCGDLFRNTIRYSNKNKDDIAK